MLDIGYIRENAKLVEQACKNKQLDPEVVEQVLKLDEQRRELIAQVQDLRQQSNANAEAVKLSVAEGGKPSKEALAKGKTVKTKLKDLEPKLKTIEEKLSVALLSVPNVPAEDVPVG